MIPLSSLINPDKNTKKIQKYNNNKSKNTKKSKNKKSTRQKKHKITKDTKYTNTDVQRKRTGG